jgi:hypothetical protein
MTVPSSIKVSTVSRSSKETSEDNEEEIQPALPEIVRNTHQNTHLPTRPKTSGLSTIRFPQLPELDGKTATERLKTLIDIHRRGYVFEDAVEDLYRGPPIPLSSEILPQQIVEVEQKWRKAAIDFRKDKLNINLEESYFSASVDYLHEVSSQIWLESKEPIKPLNPTWQNLGTNALTAFMGSTFVFTLSTSLATVVNIAADDNQKIRAAAYMSSVIVGALVWYDHLVPAMADKLKGAAVKWRTSLGNSGNSGPLKSTVGGAQLGFNQIAIYGVCYALISLLKAADNKTWGVPVKAGIASVGMVVIGQPIVTALAKYTLSRNGVNDVKYLPEMDGNRSVKDGLYLYEPAKWSFEKNIKKNPAENVIKALIYMAGGAAMYGFFMAEPASIKKNWPAAKAAYALYVPVMSFFVVAAILNTLRTWVNHKNTPAVKNSNAPPEKDGIYNSAFKQYENLLDKFCITADNEMYGEEVKDIFNEATDILSGQTHDINDPYTRFLEVSENNLQESIGRDNVLSPDQVQIIINKIKKAKIKLIKAENISLEIIELSKKLSDTKLNGSRPTDGLMIKISQKLLNLATSIKSATTNYRSRVSPPQPHIKEACNEVRDLQALLLQAQFQVGNDTKDISVDPLLKEVVKKLLPFFAALRKTDRLNIANHFIDNVIKVSYSGINPNYVLSALIGKSHSQVMMVDVFSLIKKSKTNMKRFLIKLNNSFRGQVKDDPFVKAKFLILNNLVGHDDKKFVIDNEYHINGLITARNWITEYDGLPATRERFSHGEFSAVHLAQALRVLKRQADDKALPDAIRTSRALDIESADVDQAEIILEKFKRTVGADFLRALSQEAFTHVDESSDIGDITEEALTAIWDDANKQNKIVKSTLSLSLPTEPNLVQTNPRPQNDMQFRLGEGLTSAPNLTSLVAFMDANNIARAHLVSSDGDVELAQQFIKLRPAEKKCFDLSISGIDAGKKGTIFQQINTRLSTCPGIFKSVTISLDPESAEDILPELISACSATGLPINLTMPRGIPAEKNKYAKIIGKAIKKVSVGIEESHDFAEVLNYRSTESSTSPLILIKPKIVWNHAGGLTDLVNGSSDHTDYLAELLESKELQDVVYIDLAQDFSSKYILRNTYDSLVNSDVSLPIQDALQDIIKTHQVFSVEVSSSDKAVEDGDDNLASVHRQSAETIKELHFLNMNKFKKVVATELEKPEVRAKFMKLLAVDDASVISGTALGRITDNARHRIFHQLGYTRTNWLQLIVQHPNRFLSGSNNMALGIKMHGGTSYEMNARMLYPILDIIDCLAKYKPNLKRVSEDVISNNYLNIIADEVLTIKRTQHEKWLVERNLVSVVHHKPNDYSHESVRNNLHARRSSSSRITFSQTSDSSSDV